MKNIIKLCVFSLVVLLSSCEDYLDRTPLDEVSELDFYQTPSDIQAAVNGFYNDLSGWASESVGFNILPDSYTDMGTAESPSNGISGLSYEIPSSASNSVWSFDEVREVNWLLDHVDQAEGEATQINQYIGEAYFFRAHYYFELLKRYGDVPIFTQYFDDTDLDNIYKARDPRNEVADFIISDLTTAIDLLQSFPAVEPNRISKEAAQLFKARVALFEGTWERYHSGTAFGVDGSDGSSFLQIAADAAEDVIDSGIFSLHSDYLTLFNQVGLSGNSEVMLWRDYSVEQSQTNVIQKSWPNRCGYTKFAVDSYLCTDGQPISVSPLFQGNDDLSTIENNRDSRLAALIMVPGDLILDDPDDANDVVWTNPDFSLANAGNTGYESQKYRNPVIDDSNNGDFSIITSRIIMRYAEALLIFAEAKAELGTISQGDLDKSINLLRTRVSMPGITLGGITIDPNWPNYGYNLSDILYEVRRERSVELMAEGFRGNDLYRWRAHELFDNDQPRGAYWDDGIVNVELDAADVVLDADGFILPFASTGDYNFDESKAYLSPIPLDELILNPNLVQNPGW